MQQLQTRTAISSILDSLEDMQYLTDYFDTDCQFLDDIFEDKRIQSLLEVDYFSEKTTATLLNYLYIYIYIWYASINTFERNQRKKIKVKGKKTSTL